MRNRNWYVGQIVTESDLDNVFSDVQSAERNLAIDHGLGQDSSDFAAQGGIVSGLVVTKVDGTTVQVTAGTARDDSGRRVKLSGTATVKLSNVGSTTIGSLTNATGDGGAVAVTAGKEAWISLWIKYGEELSDPHVDDDSNTVYFIIDESFRFELQLGTEAVAPATSRASLASGKVLLADILLDDAESIQTIGSVAICGSSASLKAIGYGPGSAANLSGRRGDHTVIDDPSAHPKMTNAQGTSGGALNYSLRKPTARAALLEAMRLLGNNGDATEPTGAELVGMRAKSGSFAVPNKDATFSLSAGNVATQLDAIVVELNKKVGRGGDSVAPNSGQNGFSLVGTNIATNKRLWEVKSNIAGGNYRSQSIRADGQVVPGHLFFDEFDYTTQVSLHPSGTGVCKTPRYYCRTFNANGNPLYFDAVAQAGGVVAFGCSGHAAGQEIEVQGPAIAAMNGAPPFSVVFRFKKGTIADPTTAQLYIGLHTDGASIGGGGFGAGEEGCGWRLKADGNFEPYVLRTANNVTVGAGAALITDSDWHTCRMWVSSADFQTISFQVDDGAVVTVAAGGAFAATIVSPSLYAYTSTNNAANVYIDRIQVLGFLDTIN